MLTAAQLLLLLLENASGEHDAPEVPLRTGEDTKHKLCFHRVIVTFVCSEAGLHSLLDWPNNHQCDLGKIN